MEAFLASIFCVIVAEMYGWHAGFGLAAIGMFFGMLAMIAGRKLLVPSQTVNSDVKKPALRELLPVVLRAEETLEDFSFVSFLSGHLFRLRGAIGFDVGDVFREVCGSIKLFWNDSFPRC